MSYLSAFFLLYFCFEWLFDRVLQCIDVDGENGLYNGATQGDNFNDDEINNFYINKI